MKTKLDKKHKRCPKCNALIGQSESFCRKCGHAFEREGKGKYEPYVGP